MKRSIRFLTAFALCASAGFVGCAPVSIGLPGTTASFGLGAPNQTFRISPSNCFLTGGAFGHSFGMNAAAVAGERMRQIAQIQSRFNLASSDIRAQQANWKSIVASGC
ncbi:MAG: hypothetical protein WD766_09845 [Gemmatimonadota bacterium]